MSVWNRVAMTSTNRKHSTHRMIKHTSLSEKVFILFSPFKHIFNFNFLCKTFTQTYRHRQKVQIITQEQKGGLTNSGLRTGCNHWTYTPHQNKSLGQNRTRHVFGKKCLKVVPRNVTVHSLPQHMWCCCPPSAGVCSLVDSSPGWTDRSSV